MHKATKVIFLITCILITAATAFADTGKYGVVLPNGSFIPLDGLDTDGQMKVIANLGKISTNQIEKAEAESAKLDMVPEELDKWRELITKTIRDIASDLNVAVNEFVKTPAGIGVTCLIVYKVAKDGINRVVETIFDLMVAIPIWITVLCILFKIRSKYLADTTIYTKKEETIVNGKSTVVYTDPERVAVYDFEDDENKFLIGLLLVISGVVITAVTLLIIFV